MNAQTASLYLPIIAALSRGEVIEFFSVANGGQWVEVTSIDTKQPPDKYRIAPPITRRHIVTCDTFRVERPVWRWFLEKAPKGSKGSTIYHRWMPLRKPGIEWVEGLWAIMAGRSESERVQIVMDNDTDRPAILKVYKSPNVRNKGASMMALNFGGIAARFQRDLPDKIKVTPAGRLPPAKAPSRSFPISTCPEHGVCFGGCPICTPTPPTP